MSKDHLALVAGQFAPRAQAYVESADHATGRDLDRLRDLAAQRPGSRILDVGCGGGHVSFAVAPFAREVVAYDVAPEMLAAVRAEAERRGLTAIRTEAGSAEDLPFPDAHFDMVVTRFSAHHWGDVPAALAAMRRVLAADGLAIVVDTVAPEPPRHDTFLQAIELLRDPSHVRDYTIAEWLRMLAAAGLRPGEPEPGRLRLAFAGWAARSGTPHHLIEAMRALQAAMPADVRAHFKIEEDGSFVLDTMMIAAEH